jgi:hypothetical protein
MSIRHITITVRYDGRLSRYGRSLEWIAPELKDSALTITEDQLDGPTPSRTWAGLVDGPTYDRFAEAWRLPKDTDETTSQTAGDDRELRYACVYARQHELGNRPRISHRLRVPPSDATG